MPKITSLPLEEDQYGIEVGSPLLLAFRAELGACPEPVALDNLSVVHEDTLAGKPLVPEKGWEVWRSVALGRLIAEVQRGGTGGSHDTTLYNRTYHRHNR